MLSVDIITFPTEIDLLATTQRYIKTIENAKVIKGDFLLKEELFNFRTLAEDLMRVTVKFHNVMIILINVVVVVIVVGLIYLVFDCMWSIISVDNSTGKAQSPLWACAILLLYLEVFALLSQPFNLNVSFRFTDIKLAESIILSMCVQVPYYDWILVEDPIYWRLPGIGTLLRNWAIKLINTIFNSLPTPCLRASQIAWFIFCNDMH